jgi:Fe-S cluster assembly protein SufD
VTDQGRAGALRRHGYPRDAVEALSEVRREPGWLRDQRLQAWLVAMGSPLPTTKQEQWRHTDLAELHIDEFAAFAPGSVVARPEDFPAGVREALLGDWERAGLLIQQNSDPVYRSLTDTVAGTGVIFTDLETAAREYADLVRPHLGQVVTDRDGRLAALSLAFWTGGSFLYVPANVEIALPLHALHWYDEAGVAYFPRTLIVAEENSAVTFIDEGWSSPASGAALVQSVTEIVLGPHARVNYLLLQQWGPQTLHLVKQRTVLDRDAAIANTTVALGGRLMKASLETLLQGRGAQAQLSGVAFGAGEQVFDFDTVQSHTGERTTSDLQFKAALKDRARAVYWGLVEVKKSARGADANQENRNLLLSDRARADSTPVLEIEQYDIERCSHGATVGPVDEDQLFYLRSRGIPEAEALNLLIEGFFVQAVERVPVDVLKEPIMEKIRAKLND